MEVVSAGEKVQLVGFGSFYARKKMLGETNTTVCTVKFSSGKFFKEKVNVS
jgi:nucleoid DNA-binding protein